MIKRRSIYGGSDKPEIQSEYKMNRNFSYKKEVDNSFVSLSFTLDEEKPAEIAAFAELLAKALEDVVKLSEELKSNG